MPHRVAGELIDPVSGGAPMGFDWLLGRGQGDYDRRRDALADKHTTSPDIVDFNSQGSKYGEKVDFKVGFANELRKEVAYGDISKGKMYKPPAVRDELASDEGILGAEDLTLRNGAPVYGNQVVNEEKVKDEHIDRNGLLCSAQNLGYGERGMFQAGRDRMAYEKGPTRVSDRITFDESMMNDDDNFRIAMTSQGVRTYENKLWIGSGPPPSSNRMQAIPFNV